MLFGLKSIVIAQHRVSKYEYKWAVFHPIAALNIKNKLPKAMLIYKEAEKERCLDSLAFGGKLDAFRHSFTMAYLARTISSKKLRKLGIAHEKGNKHDFFKGRKEFAERADSLACEMDLRNNELGFRLGKANKKNSDAELKQIVLAEIKNGNAWYLKRNALHTYLTCDDKTLTLLDYVGVWAVPKCLIKTNE